jgi:DNA repair exonuclease SbcCD nuclease subunit
VTIGGDLWEEEHVRRDTLASVTHELGQLRVPVLIVCGNHDPLLAGGSYGRAVWPDNVVIAPIRTPSRHDFGDVAIWAVSWGGGDMSARALDHLDIPRDGRTHLALLHGTAPTAPFAEEKAMYFPFDPNALRAAGIQHVLAGHIHQASDHGGVVYPGSPEPLGWGEQRGRHCVAIVDVSEGSVDVELVDINSTHFETRELDCSGCASSAAVVERLVSVSAAPDVFLRLELVGEVAADCEVDVTQLAATRRIEFACLKVVDKTEPMLDIEARIDRKSLDGLFTRKMRERIDSAPDDRSRRISELALEAGLRAVDGRETVLRVG